MGDKPTNRDTDDFLARAKESYGHEKITTPENTLATRRIMQEGLDKSVGTEPRRLAEAWSLYAEILMCDYLNRWNDAGPAELAEAEKAVERALQIAPDL